MQSTWQLHQGLYGREQGWPYGLRLKGVYPLCYDELNKHR